MPPREKNTQPCFPCNGSGANKEMQILSGDRKCNGGTRWGGERGLTVHHCDGADSLTCTTCQGSGIQHRYLDRREFKDDD